MTAQVFVQTDERQPVPSLSPYLRESLKQGSLMDPALVKDDERPTCRWLNCGIGKGVTDWQRNITVYGIPKLLRSGLHGELIQGLGNHDPVPLCYEPDHVLGFGNFARWVYFARPEGGPGVLGIDWWIDGRPTAGVAHSMQRVYRVAAACADAGIPVDAELALLNCRMCEDPRDLDFRQTMGLLTVEDWRKLGPELFGFGSGYCPRCGRYTLEGARKFCFCCGCEPQRIWQEI